MQPILDAGPEQLLVWLQSRSMLHRRLSESRSSRGIAAAGDIAPAAMRGRTRPHCGDHSGRLFEAMYGNQPDLWRMI
jgi:hypothetical protein